jgi:hypothetical protein
VRGGPPPPPHAVPHVWQCGGLCGESFYGRRIVLMPVLVHVRFQERLKGEAMMPQLQ